MCPNTTNLFYPFLRFLDIPLLRLSYNSITKLNEKLIITNNLIKKIIKLFFEYLY